MKPDECKRPMLKVETRLNSRSLFLDVSRLQWLFQQCGNWQGWLSEWKAVGLIHGLIWIDFVDRRTFQRPILHCVLTENRDKVKQTINLSRCWRRHLRVLWTARRSNQSILKEINPEYSWKDWCWSWSSSTLATLCKEPTHWKNPDAGKDWG